MATYFALQLQVKDPPQQRTTTYYLQSSDPVVTSPRLEDALLTADQRYLRRVVEEGRIQNAYPDVTFAFAIVDLEVNILKKVPV